MSFDELGLAPDLARAVADRGYSEPTPIQTRTIPLLLDGLDVMGAAQTGTGKTAAFVLPILQRLEFVGYAGDKQVRALVLAPTRELALQVHESVVAYGRYLSLRSAVVFGGVKIGPQIARLGDGVDVLVATPGRLLDLAQQGAVDFTSLEVLVLDEADRMLDMGFIHDIRRIIEQLPANRQTLMFSATFSREIRALASRYLDNPQRVDVAPPNTTTELVEQSAYAVPRERKTDLLVHLLKEHQWQQVLVFTRTKHGANRLSKRLLKEGFDTAAIHGNKSQNARQRALGAFKNGELQVLVATDIAARGLDIDQLPEVVNYDLPAVPEDYVHRIGRTGRAGSNGRSHSLVTPDDQPLLKAIERLIGQPVPRIDVGDFATSRQASGTPAPQPQRKPAREPSQRHSQKAGSASPPSSGDAPANGSPKPRRRRRRRGRSRGGAGTKASAA